MRCSAIILLVAVFLRATVPAYAARYRRAGTIEDLSLKIYSVQMGQVLGSFRFNIYKGNIPVIFIETLLNITRTKPYVFGMRYNKENLRGCIPQATPSGAPFFWARYDRMYDNPDFVRKVEGVSGASYYRSIVNSPIVLFSTNEKTYKWVGDLDTFKGTYYAIGCGKIVETAAEDEKFRKDMFEPVRPLEKEIKWYTKVAIILVLIVMIVLVLQLH